MLPLMYARRRIRAILKEIGRLKDSGFAYSHSRLALDHVETVFENRLALLDGLTAENDVESVRAACNESLLQVFKYHPLLGFILRSTNVRNSFELFGPLLRLARLVLGPDTKLIVSSEWNFSPHVYNPISDLPNYMLLGLPASESDNPLLVPLAGHELGHPTWQLRNIAVDFEPRIRSKITEQVDADAKKYEDLFNGELNDLFMKTNLSPAYQWALRQSEESFCDFLGLKLFGESYLLAFAYLLTPGSGKRSERYPNMSDRVANLLLASEEYGVNAPDDFSDWFSDETTSTKNEKELFLLSLAGSACSSIIDDLIRKAGEIATSSHVTSRSEEKIQAILKSFKLLTPASTVGDLTNILNAAWIAFHDGDLWKDVVDDRIDTLNELVLKSIEILEFEERTKAPT